MLSTLHFKDYYTLTATDIATRLARLTCMWERNLALGLLPSTVKPRVTVEFFDAQGDVYFIFFARKRSGRYLVQIEKCDISSLDSYSDGIVNPRAVSFISDIECILLDAFSQLDINPQAVCVRAV